jgi:hypothetical protein
MTKKAYRASAKDNGLTASTPREAAILFFERFPSRRKCNVIEGEADGPFFTVRYGKPWPRSWKDVTKKTAAQLPEG